ncbi:MAG: hypothetical protein LBD60_00235 [Puniceicoccales bacterium]|jgi:MoxR-like ATPase|nr:hypothetical protein [Puniceicoccales bacterium]
MSDNLAELNNRIREAFSWVSLLRDEMGHVTVGQRYMVDHMIVGLLTNSHILLEGVLGLAKTLIVKTLAATIRRPIPNPHWQTAQYFC